MAGDASDVRITSPMTVGGVQVSAQDLTKMVSDAKAASPGGVTDTEKVEAKPGGEGAVTDTAKPKPGALMRDGKPVAEGEFIPRERFNQELEKRRNAAKAAGIDFDTFQPIAKAAQDNVSTQGGAGGGADAPKAPEKGKEPWLSQLMAIPGRDDKDAQGNPLFEDTAAFIEAKATARAFNLMVERQGLEAWKSDQQRQQQSAAQAETQAQQRVQAFQSEVIPAALDKWGVTREGFDAKLANLQKIPGNEQRDKFIYNFALQHSKNGAELLMALGDEADTAEGVTYLTKIAGFDQNDLISELIAMDRLVQLGFTVQGKPRKEGAGAAGGKDLKTGNGGSNTKNMSASPGVGKSGAVVDAASLDGVAHLKKLKADQLAQAKETAKKFPGAVVREN